MQTPDWVKHAIFYQIFPDRFARSPRIQHPPGLSFKPWGTPPREQGFQGGDLLGIVDKLDYLQDLGINAIYLNPIFASAANHRYHTYDYLQVDPLLGGNAALRELLDQAHARGMRIILDGVFNHASRGFWPFHHILENGSDSPYIDWFHIHGWPLRPYANDEHNPPNYAAWWGLPALPKLNTDNPAVREYVMNVARHWIEFGIDGWRLDVPSEIDDDSFWQEFRHVVKSANPDAYICGEIWGPAQRWLQGDQFDAVMNYLFAGAVHSFFAADTLNLGWNHNEMRLGPIDAPTFAARIQETLGLYDWEIDLVQLNLLDSHDTPRALWLMGDDKSALRLALVFQMTMPGAPCIYYGDEIGLSAGGDPDCREAFPWHDTGRWDRDLLECYRRATAMRRQHPVLRTGSFETLYAHGQVYAFRRADDTHQAVVAFNTAREAQALSLSHEALAGSFAWQQLWPREPLSIHHEESGPLQVTLPPRTAMVLVGRRSGR
ncbi:MAG: DUF3459 domain-containing protein [Caldilineae bacterium]|nr:MAG: DUF3459 domain-containing protein [Caldilineae bacterium]